MTPWGLLWQVMGRLLPGLPSWAIACGIGAMVGAWFGYQWAAEGTKDAYVAAVARAIDQAAEITRQDEELLNDSAKVRIEIQARYRTIYRDTNRVSVVDCGDLGVDFVRLFNDTTRAADPTYQTR